MTSVRRSATKRRREKAKQTKENCHFFNFFRDRICKKLNVAYKKVSTSGQTTIPSRSKHFSKPPSCLESNVECCLRVAVYLSGCVRIGTHPLKQSTTGDTKTDTLNTRLPTTCIRVWRETACTIYIPIVWTRQPRISVARERKIHPSAAHKVTSATLRRQHKLCSSFFPIVDRAVVYRVPL